MSGRAGRFWKLRDGRIALAQSEPYPSPSGSGLMGIDVAILQEQVKTDDGRQGIRVAKFRDFPVAELTDEAVHPATIMPAGNVIDRKTVVDEHGKRHITFACELPDLRPKGGSIG